MLITLTSLPLATSSPAESEREHACASPDHLGNITPYDDQLYLQSTSYMIPRGFTSAYMLFKGVGLSSLPGTLGSTRKTELCKRILTNHLLTRSMAIGAGYLVTSSQALHSMEDPLM